MKRGIRDGDGSSKEGMKIDKKRMHIMLKQSRAGPPLIASVTLRGFKNSSTGSHKPHWQGGDRCS